MLRGFALLAGIVALFKVGNEERQKEIEAKQREQWREDAKVREREQRVRALQSAEQKEEEFKRQQRRIAPMFDGYEVPREMIEKIILSSRTAEQKREWRGEYLTYLDDFQKHIGQRGYSVYNPLLWSFGQDKVSRSENSNDIFCCSEIERRNRYSTDYSSDPLRVWYAVLGEIRHNESVFNFDYTGINWYDKKPSKFINCSCKDEKDLLLIKTPVVCTCANDFFVMFICEFIKLYFKGTDWERDKECITWRQRSEGSKFQKKIKKLDAYFSSDSEEFKLLDAYGFFDPQKSVEFMKRWNKKEEDFIGSYV